MPVLLQRILAALLVGFLLPKTLAMSSQSKYVGYDYGRYTKEILERQSSSSSPFIVTTGAKGGSGVNGSVPLRLEIRQLQKDPILWTLYILGLDFLQRQKNQSSDPESWYQLAGIHGRPFRLYDNVQALKGNENSGYCQHMSILFLPWHRPYLALYEQVLYKTIQDIAQLYPEEARDIYTASAANFRIPFWDWASTPPAGESVCPSSVCSSSTTDVDGPNGVQTIWNPLYNYLFQFNPTDLATELPDAPFDVYPHTMRYPTTQSQQAKSRNDFVARHLDSSAFVIRSRLYNILTLYPKYQWFGYEAWINLSDNPLHYDSTESLHDQLHSLIGGGGHFTYIDYSAFDPIFWLHHAMIDRVFAIWQLLNPDSYVVPKPAYYNSFTTKAGSLQDENTPLTPFRKNDSGEFWTAAEVRSTEVFGYAYPETTSRSGERNVTADVMEVVERLYGPVLE